MPPWVLGVGLVGGLGLMALLWSNTHSYNQARPDFFLHNQALVFFDSGLRGRVVLWCLASAGALFVVEVICSRFIAGLGLLGCSLGLLLVEMVEPRYWLISLVLLQLTRGRVGGKREWLLGLWWAALSVVLVLGIRSGRFFL